MLIIIYSESAYLQDSLLIEENSYRTDAVQKNCSVFKSGEAVFIRIYPDSTSFLNGIYRIDDKGCIDLPVIGSLQVNNMSEQQLVDTIKVSCIDYLPFPNIKITSLIRVSLLGGFYKPGLYWVESKNSLWDAIYLAGGLQREDGLKLLRWERDGKIVSRNLIQLFQSGGSLESMGFQSGDQLIVTSRPKSQFFREYFIPLTTLLFTTITTVMSIYSISRDD